MDGSHTCVQEKHSLTEMLWKEDALVSTSPSCSLDPTWRLAVFSRAPSCARPASVKHIISVFLHAIMQDMLVIAAGSALSKHCYNNVSIRKSQLKSSGTLVLARARAGGGVFNGASRLLRAEAR